MTPIVSEGREFSAGSRTGGGLVEIQAEGEEFIAREVFRLAKLSASIGGVVLVDGSLYGTTRNAMFCADF